MSITVTDGCTFPEPDEDFEGEARVCGEEPVARFGNIRKGARIVKIGLACKGHVAAEHERLRVIYRGGLYVEPVESVTV